MEIFVFFMCRLFFQFLFYYSHPLILGVILLSVAVFIVGILCYYGPLFGFCVFMVIVAGVLVVFSYTISLVPFKGVSYSSYRNEFNKILKNSRIKYKLGFKEFYVIKNLNIGVIIGLFSICFLFVVVFIVR